jgi:hypothetical protein
MLKNSTVYSFGFKIAILYFEALSATAQNFFSSLVVTALIKVLNYAIFKRCQRKHLKQDSRWFSSEAFSMPF